MHKFVARIVWVVVLTREPQIRSFPSPDRQWVDTCNQDPLTYVELFAQNDQWSFNIFLNYPNGETTYPDSLHHRVEVRMNLDASPTRLGSRLYDPQVASIRQTELLLSDQDLQFV